MSDTGNSSPRGAGSSGADRLNAGVMQKNRNRATSQHNRSRHRGTPAKVNNIKDTIFMFNISSYTFWYIHIWVT